MGNISDALDILQGEKNVSSGYLLPTLHILRMNMEKLISDHTILHSHCLVQTILDSIAKRFGPLFNNNHSLIAAGAAHPKFKLSWVPLEEREGVIQILRDEVEVQETRAGSSLNKEDDEEDGLCDSDTQDSDILDRRKKKDYFKSLRPKGPVKADEVDLFPPPRSQSRSIRLFTRSFVAITPPCLRPLSKELSA